MKASAFFDRITPAEVALSALFSGVPYLVAPAVKLGPTRVPIWAAVLFFVGLVIAVASVRAFRRRRSARRERLAGERRRHEDLIDRLDRLEDKVAKIAPRRRWTSRR